MNYYELLGVTKDTPQDEIKKKYRALASKHHPDKEGGNTQKFQEIQIAYDTLSDAQKRHQYDMELAGGGRQQFSFNSSHANDMHEDMLDLLRRQFGFNVGGFQSHFQQSHRPARNQDVRIAVQLDLYDTLAEQDKTLNLKIPGAESNAISIKIPRGVQHGTMIRYPGLGSHEITTAPRSDLYVQFHIKPHPVFEQDGIDLTMPLTINCFDAILGCEKSITGLDGRIFRLNIPPGSQHGKKLGIPDAGLYTTEHNNRGKLIIDLNIVIPETLTESQKETIRSIRAAL